MSGSVLYGGISPLCKEPMSHTCVLQRVAAPFFFDRHGLLDLVSKMKGKFIANVDDIRPQFRSDENAFLSQNAVFNSTLVRNNGIPVDATIDTLSGQRLDEVSGFKAEAKPWYSDQILPFDITLAGTNENGRLPVSTSLASRAGPTGSGISIADAV